MSYKFIFIFISILTINLSAQIVGTVIDISNGKPIFGANIVVGGDGTTTDKYGKFSLDIPLGIEVKISHLGYKTLKLKIFNPGAPGGPRGNPN